MTDTENDLRSEILRISKVIDDVNAFYRAEIDALNAKLGDAQDQIAQYSQLASALREDNPYIAPPPMDLQKRVVGAYDPNFLEAGYVLAKDLEQVLAPHGRSLSGCKTILDWGCGCGRVLRSIKRLHPHVDLCGTDIDEEAIAWLQQNYSEFATFKPNGSHPPIEFEDASFDLIYGISVFTHLPEDMQFQWLQDLRRLLRQDGIAILSIHGPTLHPNLTTDAQEILKDTGFFYNLDAGLTSGLPDFYKNTYHSHDYIHRKWSQYFDVLAIETMAIHGQQDAVVVTPKAG